MTPHTQPHRTPMFTLFGVLLVLAALAGAVAFAPSPVRAATTYYVGTPTNTSATTANCTVATNTTCTLRGALSLTVAGDTVRFGTSFPQGSTVDVRPGATGGYGITISSSLTIDGGGRGPRLDGGGGGAGSVGVLKITGAGAVTLRGLVIQNGRATQGAGISFTATGTGSLNISTSTFAGNSTTTDSEGGGIAIFFGAVTITNSTFSSNSAGSNGFGGAIYNITGNTKTVLIFNDTLANNTADPVDGGGGGGIYNDSSTGVVVRNTLAVNNIGGDIVGTTATTSTNNVTGDSFVLASALVDNGGPVPTFAIATTGTSNTAYRTGDLATCQSLSSVGVNGTVYSSNTAVDARGAARITTVGGVGKCSIGAYEPGGVQTIATLDTSTTSTSFGQPVTLTANVSGVLGNVPSSGTVAFRTGGGTPANIGGCTAQPVTSGVATCTTAALPAGTNAITALYTQPGTGAVYATSPASAQVTVSVAAITCTVTSTQDPTESGKRTLRDAVNAANGNACTGNAITFDPTAFATPRTITLASASGTLTLAADVTITGPTRLGRVTIDGGCTDCAPGGAGTNGTGIRVLLVNSNVTVTLANLTIANAHVRTGDDGGGNGGGIRSNGALTVTSCAFTNNRADESGAGIDVNDGTATVTGSTFTGNAASEGGGMFAEYPVAVVNSTFTGNSASTKGGGFFNDDYSSLIDSTFSGNGAGIGGGVVQVFGALTARNNLIVNSTRGGDTMGFTPDSSNRTGTFVFADSVPTGHGSLIPTLALPPGSPALDTATCNPTYTDPTNGATVTVSTDARGIPRPQPAGGGCDLGAFESQGFSLSGPTGSAQSATITTPFLSPLTLAVSSSQDEPITNGTITFTITPGAGGTNAASAVFNPPGATGCTLSADFLTATCPVNGNGLTVSPTLKAGLNPGSFTVVAHTAGVPTAGNVTYNLTNTSSAGLVTPQPTRAPNGTATGPGNGTPGAQPTAHATHTGTPAAIPSPQPMRH